MEKSHGSKRPRKRVRVWIWQQPDRPHWFMSWYCPITGRRRTRSTGTADQRRAEEIAALHARELRRDGDTSSKRMGWSIFRQLFEREYVAGLRPRSREKTATVLDLFEQLAAPRMLADIDERMLSRFAQSLREREYRGKKGLAPITVRNYLIAIKTAIRWARRQRLIRRVPAFPVVRVPRPRPRYISPADVETLIERAKGAGPEWYCLLMCGAYAGLRLSEARELRWSASDVHPWVDLDRGRIVIPAAAGKSGVDAWVPLHPRLRATIESMPRADERVMPLRSSYRRAAGRLLSRCSITHQVIRFAKECGLDMSMHDLRRAFGSRLAESLGKGGAAVLHELMRHSSMQVTMDFYANVDAAKDAAIEGLDADRSKRDGKRVA